MAKRRGFCWHLKARREGADPTRRVLWYPPKFARLTNFKNPWVDVEKPLGEFTAPR